MRELDERTLRALGALREDWSPPVGREDPLLATLHERIGSGGGGGGGGGGGVSGGGSLLHGAKIVAAVVGLTSAGLAGLAALGAILATEPSKAGGPRADARERGQDETAPVEASAPAHSSTALAPEVATPEVATSEVGQGPRRSQAALAPNAAPVSARAPVPSGPNLGEELALLQAAKKATGVEALTLLEDHARRFPGGTLASERDGLRVLTLCELGRMDDARARAVDLLEAYPGALVVERVRLECPMPELGTTGSSASGDDSQ